MSNALAMVLAGGRGERMGQLCKKRPKPALAAAGNHRVIDFCLSNCVHSGIGHVAVVTGYRGDEVARYVTNWAGANGGRCSMHVLAPKSGSYSGTADAIWQNRAFIERNGFEWVVILAADHVYKMNYEKFLRFHRETNADMTIGVSRVPMDQASRYGIVTAQPDGRVLEFREKPPAPAGNLASMGIYVFNRRTLLDRLSGDASARYSAHDFGYSVIPEMVKAGNVFAYEFNGYWRDIGTVESYYQTNMELIDSLPLLNAGRKWLALGDSEGAPQLVSSAGTAIQHSLVSPGCIVRGRVENSVLSPGVVVKERAVVRNSIVMAGTTIGEYSYVDGSILDENVSVGMFSYVGHRDRADENSLALTVVGAGVSVPAHTAVPKGSRIRSDRDLPLPTVDRRVGVGAGRVAFDLMN